MIQYLFNIIVPPTRKIFKLQNLIFEHEIHAVLILMKDYNIDLQIINETNSVDTNIHVDYV